MFITKRSIPRRTFLRGAGAMIALPMLDAMIPAMTAQAAAAMPARRFGFVYVPHSLVRDWWVPQTEGPNFELASTMKPLEAFKDQLTVVSNLWGAPPSSGPHTGGSGAWLNGCALAPSESSDAVRAGTSLDQLIAKQFGQETQFPSLELATEDVTGLVGVCDSGFSCTYVNTLCWASPTVPLPMEINPRVVFERMFGDAKTKEQRLARVQMNRAILDTISESAARIKRRLGNSDRARLSDYLDNVREIERRLQTAERNAVVTVTTPDVPAGVPESYDDHVALMFDLLTVAYQADITRVGTFMLARELSARTYPQAGVRDPHHSISHHRNDPELLEKNVKINLHHVGLFAKFLERLRATPDGDGSLLDHSMIVFGAGLANSQTHDRLGLSLAVVGGLNGTLKGNRHIKVANETPMGDALVGLGRRAGLDVQQLGLSKGAVDI